MRPDAAACSRDVLALADRLDAAATRAIGNAQALPFGSDWLLLLADQAQVAADALATVMAEAESDAFGRFADRLRQKAPAFACAPRLPFTAEG
ncbi:hypothetical protein CKO45_01345 [Paracraurococcus ruber]|uniref:Uncharacterized protein n=1 Tax=Paracraurococcus ruber TaxID=77675 RepID=A0ABS1CRR1_9PROT|nr:hypothetical protein [Paracraurococcus ruber]